MTGTFLIIRYLHNSIRKSRCGLCFFIREVNPFILRKIAFQKSFTYKDHNTVHEAVVQWAFFRQNIVYAFTISDNNASGDSLYALAINIVKRFTPKVIDNLQFLMPVAADNPFGRYIHVVNYAWILI